jgi:Galactose oxidase, central domain
MRRSGLRRARRSCRNCYVREELHSNGEVGGNGGDHAYFSGVIMPGWVPTGNLNAAREGHTATLLPNGTVLVHGGQVISGGSGAAYMSTAELFDPGSGTWTLTGYSIYQRAFHTATLLRNGKVLVVGGTYQYGLPPPPGV